MYRIGVHKIVDAREGCSEKWIAVVEPERGYISRTVHDTKAHAETATKLLAEKYKHAGINHPDFDYQRRYKSKQQEI